MTSLEGCAPAITNHLKNNNLEDSKNIGMPKSMLSERENDTDLAQLAEIWPSLPKAIKSAIKAMIQSFVKDTDNA